MRTIFSALSIVVLFACAGKSLTKFDVKECVVIYISYKVSYMQLPMIPWTQLET